MASSMSLHIGLNRVDPAHYDGWDGQLTACEFDANDMRAIAESARLRRVDDAAHRGGDGRGGSWGRSSAPRSSLGAGDSSSCSYSGHGGQVPDRNDEDDEPDRMDETWVAYDRQIVDDELYALYAKFADGRSHRRALRQLPQRLGHQGHRRRTCPRRSPTARPPTRSRRATARCRGTSWSPPTASTATSTTASRSTCRAPRRRRAATRAAHLRLPGRPAVLRRLEQRAVHGEAARVWNQGAGTAAATPSSRRRSGRACRPTSSRTTSRSAPPTPTSRHRSRSRHRTASRCAGPSSSASTSTAMTSCA